MRSSVQIGTNARSDVGKVTAGDANEKTNTSMAVIYLTTQLNQGVIVGLEGLDHLRV